MQLSSIVPAILVALISMPGYFIGQMLRDGQDVQAMQIGAVNLLMVLVAGAIMHLHQKRD